MRENYTLEFENLISITEYDNEMLHIMNIQKNGINTPQLNIIHNKMQTILLRINNLFFTAYEANSCGFQSCYEIVEDYGILKLKFNNMFVEKIDLVEILDVFDRAGISYYKYYSSLEKKFINDYLIINPLTTCYNNCPGCARKNLFYNDNDYLTNARMISENESVKNSKFIYIVTGCRENYKLDREMFINIINIFRNNKSYAEFGISTSAITDKDQMETMRDMGVIQLTGTLETVQRKGFLGDKDLKAQVSFDRNADNLILSSNYFEIVDANIVLGYDDPDILMRKLEIFKDTPVTIRYYIPRVYSEEQRKLINPVYQTLSSYAELCNYIDTEINKKKPLSDRIVQKKFGIKNIITRIVGSYVKYNYYDEAKNV